MVADRWTTTDQYNFLAPHIAGYLDSKGSGDQSVFFKRLHEGWFQLFPEEKALGLPAANSGVKLTPEQMSALGEALKKRKSQLTSWFRNNTKSIVGAGAKAAKKGEAVPLGNLWRQKTKRTRDPQLVELYQKKYASRVDAALKAEAPDDDADIDWVSREGEEPGDTLKRKIKEQSAERMRRRRAVSTNLLNSETEEVKAELEAELAQIKANKKPATEEEKLTPARAQAALDELNVVVADFHNLIRKKTGWIAWTTLGGPTPRSGGSLGYQTWTSGTSPAGNNFRASHPDWDKDVGFHFVNFLRRCWTRSARDDMALPDASDLLDDLLSMSEDEQVIDEPIPSPQTKIKTKPKPKTKQKKTKAPTPSAPNATPMGGPSTSSASLPSSSSLHPALPMSTAFQMTPTPPSQRISQPQFMYSNTINPSLALPPAPVAPFGGTFSIPSAESTDNDYMHDADANGIELGWPDVPQGMHPSVGFEFDLGPTNVRLPNPDDGFDLGPTNVRLPNPDAGGDGYDLGPTNTFFPSNSGAGNVAGFSISDDNSVGDASGRASNLFNWTETPTTTPTPPWPMFTPPTAPPRLALTPPTAPPRPALTPPTAPPRPTPTLRPTPTPPTTTPRQTPAPNTSPLPPRIARAIGGVAVAARASAASEIARSSAALEAAMGKSHQRGEEEEEGSLWDDHGVRDGDGGEEERQQEEDEDDDDDDDDEEDIPLAGADYPMSRPMANPPKPFAKPKTARATGSAGARGRGRGRGHGRGRGRGRGGGRGGGRGAIEEDGEADGGTGTGGTSVNQGTSKTPTGRTPFRFLQTYGDNNEIIPLDPDFEAPEQQTTRKAKAPAAPNLLHNPDGNTPLVILPRLPGAPMPTVPQLGRPERVRRAPKTANDDAELLRKLEESKRQKKLDAVPGEAPKKKKLAEAKLKDEWACRLLQEEEGDETSQNI
ncbi:hypothetical protein C8R43DRAFT_943623 [Mycena crocata]|nr:hypothetical protein C8R43DRAFT_943623 [Mycena crocata]